jgi:hypothetical protein
MTHTPEPWAVCSDGVNVHAPESDTAITNQSHPCAPNYGEAHANALLIAAAPTMLAVLESAVSILALVRDSDSSEYVDDLADAVDAAIAKAGGSDE